MVSLTHFTRILLALATTTIVVAQSDKRNSTNYFVTPPSAGSKVGSDPNVYLSNRVYQVDTVLTLQWVTTLPAIQILLWKEGVASSKIIQSSIKATSYTWSGSLDSQFQLDQDLNVFFFAAYDPQNTGNGPVFYSHYFNMTQKTSSTSSTVTLTSATSSSQSSTTGTTSLTSVTSSASGSSSSSGSQLTGSSVNAAAIGGGVGGGIGGAILVVGLAFLAWKHCNNKKESGFVPPQVLALPKYGSDNSPMSNTASFYDASTQAQSSVASPNLPAELQHGNYGRSPTELEAPVGQRPSSNLSSLP